MNDLLRYENNQIGTFRIFRFIGNGRQPIEYCLLFPPCNVAYFKKVYDALELFTDMTEDMVHGQ